MSRISFASFAVLAAGLVGAMQPVRAGGALSFFSTPSGDVFIITDVMPAGKKLVPPTKDNPVYCAAINFGCSFGSLAGDRLPDNDAMRDLVVKILADQGFQGNDEMHPPALLLTFQWGYLRGDLGQNLAFLGAEKLDLVSDAERVGLGNPDALLHGMRSDAGTKVMDLMHDDLYVMTVCAFDHAAYSAGRAEMLWKTRIATATIGLSMAKALPDMIAMAGPAIGRETTKVIIANPADKREGKVKYGELEVIDDDDAPAPKEKK